MKLNIAKTLIVGIISIGAFALPICSALGWRDTSGIGLTSWIFLFFSNVLYFVLFVFLFLTDWREDLDPESMAEITETWRESIAYSAVLSFSVLVPIIVVLIECSTHMVSKYFVNIVPANVHVALLVLGPAINLFLIVQLYMKNRIPETILSFLNGVAISIAALFSIVVLPILLPIEFIAVFGGIGWLPFAPMLALVATIKLFTLVKVLIPSIKKRTKSRLYGILSGIALFVIVQCPVVITNCLVLALAKNPTDQNTLAHLRNFGDKEHMLKLCYGRRRIKSIAEIVSPVVSLQDARRVFFEVTGTQFGHYEVPESIKNSESER